MKTAAATALVVLALSGCGRRPARPEDCRMILDRIVDLELRELGFRDPALASRKAAEVRRSLGAELVRCQGVRIRKDALDCVRLAGSAEEISHHCLR